MQSKELQSNNENVNYIKKKLKPTKIPTKIYIIIENEIRKFTNFDGREQQEM